MIRSMTGFARAAGTAGTARWAWELKTVNAKGLDLRLRLPPGFDSIESEARRRLGLGLARGTCHAGLTVARDVAATESRINLDLLASLARALAQVPVPAGLGPATIDGLLGIRGVVETGESTPDAAELAMLQAQCLAGLDPAIAALLTMRESEGAVLGGILSERLETITRLTLEADRAPQRQPAAVAAKLARAIAALSDRHGLDPDRLHQEALLLAAKADVREELDRLVAHGVSARELIEAGGPVGRRLDFLAQELGREASTFCAKANDAALTAIGLELRVEIEQFREQVQNIE